MSDENFFGFPGDLPPNLVMLQLITGKWVMQAIYVAAELGIADHLKDGPRSSRDIARVCGTQEDATYRLMRALANVGVLDERDSRTFALTPVGYKPTWAAWGEALHSVRTGEPAVDHLFGKNLFEYYATQLEESAIFDDAMTSISTVEAHAVAAGYDFSGIGTLADVGGGRGYLLATILEANPTMQGILFDQPHVVAGAPPLLRERGVDERVHIQGGSFLETAPSGADGMIMKHIIHDWNDEDCVRILRNCHRALPKGGRILIVEAVVPAPAQRGWAKLLDLEMLVLTPRGRERNKEEYATLLQDTGFRLTRVVPTASHVSVVEGERL